MTSPNWPNMYPRDYESTRAIQVEKGHHIKLNFTHFDTELDSDFVWIPAGNGKDLGPGEIVGPLGGSQANIPASSLCGNSLQWKSSLLQQAGQGDQAGGWSGLRIHSPD